VLTVIEFAEDALAALDEVATKTALTLLAPAPNLIFKVAVPEAVNDADP
jgi:hypothetical protein